MSHTVEVVVPPAADVDGAGETHAVEVEAGQSILAAARDAGLWLPADCQQGWCTRCAARLVSGEVDQSAARRYYDADAAADLVLTCTAVPETDCRVEACRYETMLDHRADHDLPPGNAKR